MIELTSDEKNQYIQQRLRQYAAQRFNFELDLAAYQATRNTTAAEHVRGELVKLEKAYEAVAAQLVTETE